MYVVTVALHVLFICQHATALVTRPTFSSTPSSSIGYVAFADTNHRHRKVTTPWGVKPAVAPRPVTSRALTAPQGQDSNFDGIDLVNLLGRNQLRRLKRKMNAEKRVKARPSGDDDMSPIKAPRIIIAGAPASGKGTQCEKIKEQYGVVHLSTGDMLRVAVAQGTEVGKKAKEYMDSGKLVPDDVIIGVVKDRLSMEDCQKQGWLLDGFPRTQAQAKALQEAGIQADCFIFLNVPDEILVERVVGRRTDPVTGKIYHMTFSPPNDEAVLARLEQRSDDTEEKVKVRLEQFHANVKAVQDSYTDISVTVDGNQPPDIVSELIFSAVSEKLGEQKVAA